MTVKNALKVSFFINSKSGGGEGLRLSRYIPEIMGSFGFLDSDWEIHFLGDGDFVETVKDLSHRSERLIAMGGDGTLSGVLEQIAKYSGTSKVGLIPLGTGNDLGRVMNIFDNFVNKGLLNTLRKLLTVGSQSFDLWSVDGKLTMAAYVSAGVDAAATNEFAHARETKNYKQSVFRNRYEYVVAFFKKMNCRIPEGTTLEMWDAQGRKYTQDVSGYFSLLVGNIGSYAGGWQPFKQTDYSDGLLEVVPLASLFDFLKCTLTALPFFARIWGKSLVPSRHCAKVAICSDENFEVQVDGEGRNDLGESPRLEVTYMGLAEILVLD